MHGKTVDYVHQLPFSEYRMVNVTEGTTEPYGYVSDSVVVSRIPNIREDWNTWKPRKVLSMHQIAWRDWTMLIETEAYGWKNHEWTLTPFWYVAR